MVPYILALIILIVAVLFQVYLTEPFANLTSDFTVTATTSIKDYVSVLQKIKTAAVDVKEDIAEYLSSTTFAIKKDEFDLVNTDYDSTKTVTVAKTVDSETLKARMLSFINVIDTKMKSANDSLNSGTLKGTDPYLTKLTTPFTIDKVKQYKNYINAVIEVTNPKIRQILKEKQFKDQKEHEERGGRERNEKHEEHERHEKGNDKLIYNKDDVIKAFATYKYGSKKEHEHEHEHADADPTSSHFNKELEKRLARDIATQVKDQLLVSRATTNPVDQDSQYASCNDQGDQCGGSSTCTDQGADYIKGVPSKMPDMSQYVKKDSIPCWGCSMP